MDLAPMARTVFSSVNEKRDLIFIDQRGMGSSHPLECHFEEEEIMRLSLEEQERRTRELIKECLDELDADPIFYTQDLANQDIHEIVQGLGYTQVNAFGASWGTRSALLYAHQFPDQVRTLVLDGNLPLNNIAPTHSAEDADRALRRLFEDCAADSDCQKAYPDLEADYRQVVTNLGPEGTRIDFDNPSTGEAENILLTPQGFGDALRAILYSPDLSRLLPLIIHRASRGEYRPFLGVSATMTASTGDTLTLGATFTIFCSEELARRSDGTESDGTEEEEESEVEEPLLGNQMLQSLESACEIWPKAPLPAIYREDVRSEAPALLLSGDLDPITPPHWGDEMAKVLPNSLHLLAPGTGHNVSPFGCAADLIDQFIDQGDLEGIDGSCLQELARPSFFTHSSGPGVHQDSGSTP